MKLLSEKVKCVENYLFTKLENLRINGVLFDVLLLTTLGTVGHNSISVLKLIFFFVEITIHKTQITKHKNRRNYPPVSA